MAYTKLVLNEFARRRGSSKREKGWFSKDELKSSS
jgi:hypothetical protein